MVIFDFGLDQKIPGDSGKIPNLNLQKSPIPGIVIFEAEKSPIKNPRNPQSRDWDFLISGISPTPNPKVWRNRG